MNISDGNENKTSLLVSWMKPEGGDRIDRYDVILIDRINISTVTVAHQKGKVFYNREIAGLLPGQSYSISICVRNSVGNVETNPVNYTTGKSRFYY